MSAHHQPAKSYGIPQQVPQHHILSQQTANGAAVSDNTSKYMQHVVSQSYNPLKTTLGHHDEVTPESSMLASVEKKDQRPLGTATTLSQDSGSESEDIEAQYEMMQ